MVAAFIPISAFTRMFRKATQLQETSTVSDMFYCRMNVRRRRGALEPVGGEDGPPISSSPSMPVPGTTSFAPSSPREHATTCEKSSTVDGAAGSSGIGNTMPLTAGNSIGNVPKRAVINRPRQPSQTEKQSKRWIPLLLRLLLRWCRGIRGGSGHNNRRKRYLWRE